jgi:hypothetical protein
VSAQNIGQQQVATIATNQYKFKLVNILRGLLKGTISPVQVCLEVKGSVQQKLRWVENVVDRSVGASDCGAGRSFVVLFRFHLGFAIFPFPVSTVKIIGEFWIIRRSGTSDVAPMELALYSCYS